MNTINLYIELFLVSIYYIFFSYIIYLLIKFYFSHKQNSGSSKDRLYTTIENNSQGFMYSFRLDDLILFLFLLISSFKLIYFIDYVQDINNWDEAEYLRNGILLNDEGLNAVKESILYAPLYNLWYSLLSIIESDPVNLYLLNYKVLIVTNALLFYVCMRRFKTPPTISIVGSFIYLISSITTIFPLIMLFVLIIILVTLIITTCYKAKENKIFILGCGLLLTSFIRPEYFYTTILFSIYPYVLYFRKNKDRISFIKTNFYKIIFFAGLFIFLFSIFGNPVSGKRSWAAFSQHYSQNYLSWHSDIKLNTDYTEEITKLSFGKSNSLYEAFKSNRPEFLHHISKNFNDYIVTSIYVILERPGVFPSVNIFSKGTRIFQKIIILIVVFLFIAKINEVIRILKDNTFIVLFFFSIFSISMLSSTVIYAREHYLIVQDMVALFLCALILSKMQPVEFFKIKCTWLNSVILGTIIFLITPNLVSGYRLIPSIPLFEKENSDKLKPTIKIINFIKLLKIKNETGVLWFSAVNSTFIGKQFKIYPPHTKKNESLKIFIENKNIGIIADTEALREDYYLKNDSEFIAFLSNPSPFGFSKVKLPDSNMYIFVKSKFLSE